ncbi:MAG: hypothetical protein EBY39_11835 [Flavobacteriia bacterium]|nr:hypothetical protein [Flavobacteriia bacterium]
MFKNIKKDFANIDHPLKKQMARLLSMTEDTINFLPDTSDRFNQILEKAKKTATINLISKNKEYNLQLLTYAGAPIVLESSSETSYLVLRSIDIV